MRVISQNRKISVDFDRTVFTVVDNYIFAKIDGRDVIFGGYESDKHAEEVFKDMHMAYAPVFSISNKMTEEQIAEIFIVSKNMVTRNILDFGNEASVTTYDKYVYFMPEK